MKTLLPKIFFFLAIFFIGCAKNGAEKNFYLKTDSPKIIERLSKEEFNLQVKASLTENCLWVYLPLKRFLDESFNPTEEALLDLDHVALVTARVLLNTTDPAEFYSIVISDVKTTGADYVSVVYTQDLKRYYYSRISRGDFAKRKVFYFKLNPAALNDWEGSHIETSNVDLHQFLAQQIAQRIEARLKEVIKAVDADYQEGHFVFSLDILKIGEASNIDVFKESFKIISAVLKDYDFKDFTEVEISESLKGKTITFNQKALFESFK